LSPLQEGRLKIGRQDAILPYMPPVRIVINKQQAGGRLDHFLQSQLPAYSRSRLQDWITTGQQKAAAWREVARRIAHEIRNPLTPIALSAERIGRQLERQTLPPEVARIVKECTAIIATEVESVKTLVNEFSQFARFPT